MKKITLLLAIVVCCNVCTNAQSLYENKYQWRIPGGNYVNPESFFSMHGYVNGVFGGPSDDWKKGTFNAIGMPGQLLVPNTANSSFQSDEAIWISSEISSKASCMMELHLVSDPSGKGMSGPGGLTIVLTEATANYKLIENYLNVSFGTFWSPFGIHNNDWLGAQNLFTLIPVASGAYPTHYNEKGVRADGYIKIGEKSAINYVASIGNGYDAWDISGYRSWDLNENKTVNGRVSVFPGLEDKLNIGVSIANGQLNVGDSTFVADYSGNFVNSFTAYGADLKLKLKQFSLRGYGISSAKRSVSDSLNLAYNQNMAGAMIEMSYRLVEDKLKILKSIEPKVRVDWFNEDVSTAGDDTFTTISCGANINLEKNFIVSVDYNFLEEKRTPIDNNRLIIRVSAKF